MKRNESAIVLMELIGILAFVAGVALLLVLTLVQLAVKGVSLLVREKPEPAVTVEPAGGYIHTRREVVDNLPTSIQSDFRTRGLPLPPPRAYTRADASGHGPWPFS